MNIIEQLNNIILEAEIVGMYKQEDKFGYADTSDLDEAIIRFLEVLKIKNYEVYNGYINLANGGNLTHTES